MGASSVADPSSLESRKEMIRESRDGWRVWPISQFETKPNLAKNRIFGLDKPVADFSAMANFSL